MIIYNKLANLLKERGLQWNDLCNAGININAPAKFSKNRNMNTNMIDKVCLYLGVQPGDIMEVVQDEDELKKRSIESQIEDLQRQLTELQQKTK